MTIMPMTEFDRFLIMYERLFDFVETYIHKTPKNKYDWKPVDGPDISFGERLEDITIKGLYIHLTVSEDGFVNSLLNIEDDDEIPLPINKELSMQHDKGDFVKLGRELHDDCIDRIRTISAERLTRTVWFQGGEYSVQGFLWAMYAHYAYHLGNIDTYMRQGDLKPTAFFNFTNPTMA